jgi:hypothetical protein
MSILEFSIAKIQLYFLITFEIKQLCKKSNDIYEIVISIFPLIKSKIFICVIPFLLVSIGSNENTYLGEASCIFLNAPYSLSIVVCFSR